MEQKGKMQEQAGSLLNGIYFHYSRILLVGMDFYGQQSNLLSAGKNPHRLEIQGR